MSARKWFRHGSLGNILSVKPNLLTTKGWGCVLTILSLTNLGVAVVIAKNSNETVHFKFPRKKHQASRADQYTTPAHPPPRFKHTKHSLTDMKKKPYLLQMFPARLSLSHYISQLIITHRLLQQEAETLYQRSTMCQIREYLNALMILDKCRRQ